MGSIAFGAAIIAIMQMIKLAFEYFRKKFEKVAGKNTCTKILVCLVGCCISCVDRCVRCITKNAYIQIALTSENFCVSVWNAFFLLVRNCARYSIVSSLSAILMFLGKAVIVTLSGFIGYVILVNSYLKDEIYSPILPVIVIVAIAYLIGSVFLSVYSFASLAILHCFLLDEEI
jgi:choline transporter-like protein 2/4/5